VRNELLIRLTLLVSIRTLTQQLDNRQNLIAAGNFAWQNFCNISINRKQNRMALFFNSKIRRTASISWNIRAPGQPRAAIIATISLILSHCAFADDRLAPFTSDGCSIFPDGTSADRDLWESCCIEHDVAYWRGGAYAERVAADDRLQQCVAAAGEPGIADLMLAGVSVGGSPYFPTMFRWAYGWPFTRGYKALDEDERKLASALLLNAYELWPQQN
jgi:hypothetical protein